MSAAAEITLFTKQAGPNDPDGALMSKRIKLGADGKPVSDGSPCRMSNGSAETMPADDAAALAKLINTMRQSQALSVGSIKNSNGSTPVRVVTAKKLKEQNNPDSIARTREHIVFRPGARAWMLIDTDSKGMPPEVRAQPTVAGGYWNALLQVAPGLARAERAMRGSTSAGLSHRDTGVRFQGSDGQHNYVLAQDGSDIPRALRALHDRCCLHALGWFLIGSVGQLLERSIIDAAVRSSEHLAFEGPPDVVPPLLQDQDTRVCLPFAGVAIDTRTAIPDLSQAEKQMLQVLKENQRQALEPLAQPIRAAADQRLVEDLIARTGMPRTHAIRQVQARHRGVLGPEIMLTTDYHGAVSVGQILADPEKYIGETLCDPLEGPAYGYTKAQVRRSARQPGRVFINSFAHGGATFDLTHDVHSARRLLAATPEAELGNVLCEVVACADLEEDETRQLLTFCAERAPKIGLRVFTRRLKDDRLRRDKARRAAVEMARQAAGAIDQRQRRPCPPTDGEVTPVVRDVDRVLSEDDSEYPPMRRPGGSLVEVRLQVPFDMHQLTSDTGNAEPDAKLIPPPPELLMETMTPTTVNMLIERYFIWEKTDNDGNFLYNSGPAERFLQAFMQLNPTESGLPHIRSVVTAPMILANGDVLDGVGLDRSNGLYYAIEPSLRDCLPQGEITSDDVQREMRFLLDEWLGDVLTDAKGKLIAISMGLSIIQRHLLDQRPAFLITAGQRGGGKTTLIHMTVMAALGRMASAAAWSTEPEERRKALFSYFLQGVAAIAWDNLPTGTAIACAHIEESLTSPTYTDRILSFSKSGTTLTSAIQMFSANNATFSGDMASRGLRIRLETDDPHPEDRAVKHSDPIGWTQANRARLLRAFYTSLIYACRERPANQEAKTRFKRWWNLVGWPVELAASLVGWPVDFSELFKESEEQDSVVHGVVAALRLLSGQFGSVERGSNTPDNVRFMARDIGRLIKDGEDARAQKNRTQKTLWDPDAAKGADPAVTTADGFLEMIEGLTGRRQRSPSSKVIGRVLNKIVGRPVELDDATIGILRLHTLHGDVRYHVETHGGARRPGNDRVDYYSTQPTASQPDNKHLRPDDEADGSREPDEWEVSL
jgi:hypothetical protein